MLAFCERDEKYLAGALHNLNWVDDIVVYDNRGKEYKEREMRLEMKQQAIDKGADWILEQDVDERFEKRAESIFRRVTEIKQKVIYRVNFRELYAPDLYRVDKGWIKYRYSLYPVYSGQKIKDKAYNVKTWPINEDYKRVNLDVNLYHLKMIDIEDRIKRSKWLKEIDPYVRTQARGYDYLLDESNIKLERIPRGHEYL